MADFCGRCLTDEGMGEYAARNDFAGLAPPGEVIGELCEGCGVHLFNHEGWPVCGTASQSWYENPEQNFIAPCRFCWPDSDEHPDGQDQDGSDSDHGQAETPQAAPETPQVRLFDEVHPVQG